MKHLAKHQGQLPYFSSLQNEKPNRIKMNDFPGNYYYQVAIIFTNRLLGRCSCLGVITWHFPEQVQGLVRAATSTWFGATTSSPFPAVSPCSPYETRTGPRGHRGPQHLQTRTSSSGRSRTSRSCPAQKGSASRSCWVSHRELSTQPLQRMARLESQAAACCVCFVEAVLKTACPFLDWLWSREKRFQKKKNAIGSF